MAIDAVRELCRAVVDELHERWDLPSVYLLVDGRLRCHSSRGYFQVSDGLAPGAGVIGRVVASGVRELIEDVTTDPAFIAAIPGLRSEACVPVWAFGEVVGALNLESRTTLGEAAITDLEATAQWLGVRLEQLGGLPVPTLAEQLGRIAVTLARLTEADAVEALAVSAARELSGASTGALARTSPDGWVLQRVDGPLAEIMQAWDQQDFQVLAGWVRAGSSSHFPDGEVVPRGYEFLGTGIHSLSIHPLTVGNEVVGMLLAADEQSAPHDPVLGAALELLASQTAATLTTVEALAALGTQARRDPLTGLANRRELLADLEAAVGAGPAALVLLDLDGFKGVNDHYGHAEGDELLCAVARRLRATARHHDQVYRLGGDEFAVLVRGAATSSESDAVGQRLVQAATAPTEGCWHPTIGASAGVRLTHGATAAAALVDADAALYAAKHRGRGTCVVWEPSLRREADHSRDLVEDLRKALAAGELHLVFQPIVDIATLEVKGLEALSRWNHPTRGLIAPDVFVGAAERFGLIAELTRWVLGEVCRLGVYWAGDLKLGLNVSAAQLTGGGIVEDVAAALATSGLPAGRLVLEVTETTAVSDLPRAKRTLEALAELGVVLALDDFGTGHSSLTHAHELPFDILKIDRSFVSAAARGDRKAKATVAAVAALGAGLGVDVVAEGIEDLAELAVLSGLGCGFAQGFALSRPLDAEMVSRLLATQAPWTAHRALAVVPPALPEPRPPVQQVAPH